MLFVLRVLLLAVHFVLASVVGLLGSVSLDMPAAPSILVVLTAMLLVHGTLLALWRRIRRPAA